MAATRSVLHSNFIGRVWHLTWDMIRAAPKAVGLILSAAIIGAIGSIELGPNESLAISTDMTGAQVLAALAVLGAATLLTIVVAFVFAPSRAVANDRLAYASTTAAFAACALVLKTLFLDSAPGEGLRPYLTFDGPLKELFGLFTTPYAFLAGFLLLHGLQEFSQISSQFRQELDGWRRIYHLLDFFRTPRDQRVQSEIADYNGLGPIDPIKSNDIAARAGQNRMTDLTAHVPATRNRPAEHRSVTPEQGLRELHDTIHKLSVEDANDGPALSALIEQYGALGTLLNQRQSRAIKAPWMLNLTLWLLTTIVLILATVGINGVFDPAFLRTGVGDYAFAAAVMLVALPLVLINITIMDLRDPFSGEWSIPVETDYGDLAQEFRAMFEERSGESGIPQPAPGHGGQAAPPEGSRSPAPSQS